MAMTCTDMLAEHKSRQDLYKINQKGEKQVCLPCPGTVRYLSDVCSLKVCSSTESTKQKRIFVEAVEACRKRRKNKMNRSSTD
jgi:hypothetical protein